MGNQLVKIDGLRSRPAIQILKTDSEEEILMKLMDALITQDCDVIWEKGEYIFENIYRDMYPVHRFGRNRGTYELPVGGNCHYYFNNSTIIGKAVEELGDTKLFGNLRRGGCPFEMFDGTLVAEGMTYVIHDEGQISEEPYIHKYKNLKLIYKKGIHSTNGSTCFGGGTGLSASVNIEDCTMETDNDLCPYDLAYHGNLKTDVLGLFTLRINGCYFEKGVYFGQTGAGDNLDVYFRNNSYIDLFLKDNRWKLNSWCNEKR